MKHKARSILISALLLTAIASCTHTNPEKADATEKRQYIQQQNPVNVIILEKGIFKKELVNNGKLTARRKSELRFRVSEQLETLAVKNGDRVGAGQVIATLVPFTYQQQLSGAKVQLQKAHLELQNILIGQGYMTTDSTQMPPHIYGMAVVRSGYAEALQGFQTAEFSLKATRLTAPYSGLIGNIKQKVHEQVSSGEVFCTLIDDSEFEVEFKLVESEITTISMGDEVQVIPFSDSSKNYKGQISEINPLIDENGMIGVKARLRNPGSLLEGMNVKVLVEKDIPGQMVVPKSAVVLRQNQEVLFKCTKDSIAFWTYVQTVAENSASYAVVAHPDKGGILAPGDTVIISGNLNLAHESAVIVQ
ncbi:efflux RND transporter periplasmic adaptor subunit [Gaoshiqia sp. Z1-71]|uniref:efflux RND transporter periplasmic adaptor subunit n=1 Tax=Gaoshiqia hydrogeniformans TaxID=3290090 RepID=UPI003BF7C61A